MMNVLPPVIPVNPDSSKTIEKLEVIASSELGGAFEFLKLETCGVSVCECDSLSLYFQSRENSRLRFSLYCEVIDLKFKVKPGNQSLAERIEKELTSADRLDLIGLIAYDKSEQFKKLDVKRLGIDKRGEKALLADLGGLIPFNYVFPWAPGIVYENKKGRIVTVIDRYCTNPACPCTEALVEIASCEVHPFTPKNKVIEAEFFYDYKIADIPSHEKKRDLKESRTALAELKATEANLNSFLKQRHAKIHQLADHLSTINQPKLSTPAAGRNSPCPCGSGKKYKKCCG